MKTYRPTGRTGILPVRNGRDVRCPSRAALVTVATDETSVVQVSR